MESFGDIIRNLREARELPLRTVAAFLDIDQAILSKVERGHRKANRQQVVKLAEFFQYDSRKLLVSWLADKVLYEISDEDLELDAIKLAEEMATYKKTKKGYT